MKSFYERDKREKDMIRAFYQFEANMLQIDPLCADFQKLISAPNPFYTAIMQLEDGKELIDELNFAIEMAYSK